MAPCTSAGCYLSQNGGLVSFPLVTIAGIVDGINPCAISMLVLLLTYLIIFAKREDRVLKTGLLYASTIYLTYLTIGLFFYKSVSAFDLSSLRNIINPVIGGLLLIGANIVIINRLILVWPLPETYFGYQLGYLVTLCLGNLIGCIALGASMCSFQGFLKVLIAPKVFLIDYIEERIRRY